MQIEITTQQFLGLDLVLPIPTKMQAAAGDPITAPIQGVPVTIDLKKVFVLSGGVPPYKNWRLAPGSALPTGLTLSADGVISGTPTVASALDANGQLVPFKFSVLVDDSGN